jgi:hypothetical protein
MPTTPLGQFPLMPACPAADGSTPGAPWSIRLAGARSARPALELYEDGVLLDVVSSTPVAPQLVRGARTATQNGCQRVIAWGRLPPAGPDVAVEFCRGAIRCHCLPAAVIKIYGWCWLAVAEGQFDKAIVRSGGRHQRHRLAGGQRWR